MTDLQTVKVRVNLTIEVNRSAWDREYGTKESAEEIRHAVKYAAQDAVEIGFAHLTPEVLTVRDSNL